MVDGRSVEITAAGLSMRPTLAPGDRLLISPLPPRGPALGDVVAIVSGDADAARIVVHRVLWCRGAVIRTAGDDASALDHPHPRRTVVGRVDACWGPDGVRRSLRSPGARLVGMARGMRSVARIVRVGLRAWRRPAPSAEP